MNQLMKQEQGFTPDQIALLKSQIAPKATDDELKMFVAQCQRTGLDPFARQIYCIHRNQKDDNGNQVPKMSIQISIDGARLIALRTGIYAGQDEPEFVLDDSKRLIAAKVTVYAFSPSGQRYPAATGVAYWSEYAQNSPMWSKMPRTMLAKCAESVALRKAFPQELSGLYTTEEMEQAAPTLSLDQLNEIDRLLENSTIESGSKEWKVYDMYRRNPEMITPDIHQRMLNALKMNQRDPVSEAGNYNQSDYKRRARQFDEVEPEIEN